MGEWGGGGWRGRAGGLGVVVVGLLRVVEVVRSMEVWGWRLICVMFS